MLVIGAAHLSRKCRSPILIDNSQGYTINSLQIFDVMSGPSFDFRSIFILDIANNHKGSIEHGKKIISECAFIAKKNYKRSAIKFQFRYILEFINPNHYHTSPNKHVPRFITTKLPWDAYSELALHAKP